MAKMAHRGGSKIKKEHHFIPGLRRLLEHIEPWPEIISIIPGEIRKARHGHKITLTIQYQTVTGVKCLARSSMGIQEVFLVSSQPGKLRERLEQFLS